MKKLFGVVAVAACLSLGVVDEAKAGGPFCVTFPGFCDQITIRTLAAAGRTWIVGNWDWTCAGGGVDDTLISGVNDGFAMATQPESGGVPAGANFTLKIHSGATLLDFMGTFDGVTIGFFIDNTPAAVAAGSCPGQPVNAGPRLTDR